MLPLRHAMELTIACSINLFLEADKLLRSLRFTTHFPFIIPFQWFFGRENIHQPIVDAMFHSKSTVINASSAIWCACVLCLSVSVKHNVFPIIDTNTRTSGLCVCRQAIRETNDQIRQTISICSDSLVRTLTKIQCIGLRVWCVWHTHSYTHTPCSIM